MPKNDNSQSIRLYESLKKTVGQGAADEFAAELPLSKSASFDRKFQWAEELCSWLESRYTEEEIQKIRAGCSCNPPESHLEHVRKLYTGSADLYEFADRYNTEYSSTQSIRYDGANLYFSYNACYCSCVKHVDKPLSKTWCACTVGYTKKLFDCVFGCETRVELLESIKLGNSRCVMKISCAQLGKSEHAL